MSTSAKRFRYDAEHPLFTHPSGDTPLWRYVDFTKLVALLEARALFLPRADRLGDPWEGSVSPLTIALREASLREIPELPLSDDPAERASQEESRRVIFERLSEVHRHTATWTYVSCWHASEYESAAMWAQYVPNGQAVAIRTTFDRLTSSLPWAEEGESCNELFAGLVEYLDYDQELVPEGNTLAPFMCKRRSFEHERELRVITCDLPVGEGSVIDWTQPPVPGLDVPVELDRLVAAVHVAPETPDWIVRLVESQVRRVGLEAPVERSTLEAPPTH